MKKIPEDRKREALGLWLSGQTYRQVCEDLGISLGTISEIVEEARKKEPDLDELRHLNMMLKKRGSNIQDATRGLNLLDKLNEHGLSLDELSSYLELCERISVEHKTEVEAFVNTALGLMRLEERLGRPYQDALADLQSKLSQLPQLNSTVTELEARKAALEKEVEQSQKQVTSLRSELGKLVKGRERLEKLGLERLNELALFVESFEALGFSPERVKDLSGLQKDLSQLKIGLDGIKKVVKIATHLQILEGEIKLAEGRVQALSQEFASLSAVAEVLRKRTTYVTCHVCRTSVPLLLPNRSEITAAITQGRMFYGACQFGHQNWFSPVDLLASVGWAAAL